MSLLSKPWKQSVSALAIAALAATAWWAALPGAEGDRRTAGRGIVRNGELQLLPSDLLDGGVAWINSGPIKMQDLKGKIVVLDFWTYCCINCHHVLPDLAKLEEKYKNQLVVIGVHTPKFPTERDVKTVRQKVREYGIRHPVVCDSDQIIWNRLGVNSWPTVGVLDPEGKVVFATSGEGHLAELDRVIGAEIEKARANKTLDETPVKFFPEVEKPDETPLLFPGKVVADEVGNRLFVADTGHNRIVMTDLSGKTPVLIGSGSTGLTDGAFEKAEFHRPQGMALVGDVLYVADTENHAIRAVNLTTKTVTTVAGTGEQSRRVEHVGPASPGKRTALNSPWDLAHVANSRILYIAMAGSHQIWHMDLETDVIGLWAGTGHENIVDGPIGAAAFAQPSGLTTDGHHLFVADSEVSAIRSISLGGGKHNVVSIVGEGLFEFGDVDGRGAEVRLQHCLGVAFGAGKLFIADTYNNKVKICDPKTRSVKTLVGTGKAGDSNSPAQFSQPGGLSVAGKALYVADTNNHQIRVVNLADDAVRTLALGDLSPPAVRRKKMSFPNATTFKPKEAHVAPAKILNVQVNLPIDEAFVLNEEGALPVLVETPGHAGIIAAKDSGVHKLEPPSMRFTLPVELSSPMKEGDALNLKVSVQAFVCNKGSKFCTIKSFIWEVAVTVAEDGKEALVLGAE